MFIYILFSIPDPQYKFYFGSSYLIEDEIIKHVKSFLYEH